MRKKLLLISVLLLLTVGVLGALIQNGPNSNTATLSALESPYIAVAPSNITDTTLTPSENFTVSIDTNYSGNNVTSWQFTLNYNPNVLHGINVTNGDLIVDGTAMFIAGTFNNTAGELSLTGALFFATSPPPAVTSGLGTLANVTFTVVGYGNSSITLGPKTQLIGWNHTAVKEYFIVDAETMPDHIQHGYFNNRFPHDVAVINVTPSKTIVGEGYSTSINVTAENQGEHTETFNVTAHANTTIIDTLTNITLTSGNSTTITLTWDTTGVPYGNYTISATATPVPAETDIVDNTFIDGWVFVAIAGEVNLDGIVDIFDGVPVAAASGARLITDPQDPRFGEYWHDEACPRCPHDPCLDLNQDGVIDGLDLEIVENNYGETW